MGKCKWVPVRLGAQEAVAGTEADEFILAAGLAQMNTAAYGALQRQHVGRVGNDFRVAAGGDGLVLVDQRHDRVGAQRSDGGQFNGGERRVRSGKGQPVKLEQHLRIDGSRADKAILLMLGKQRRRRYPGRTQAIHLEQERLQVSWRQLLGEDGEQVGSIGRAQDAVDELIPG